MLKKGLPILLASMLVASPAFAAKHDGKQELREKQEEKSEIVKKQEKKKQELKKKQEKKNKN